MTAAFKSEFGNCVFGSINKDILPLNADGCILSILIEKMMSSKKGIEYITVLELLSRCDAIVGTNTGTVRAAIALNNSQYEYINVLE